MKIRTIPPAYSQILQFGLLQKCFKEQAITTVIQAVETVCGLPPGSLVGDDQTRRVADPRKLAMYICLWWKLARLTDIGKAFNNRMGHAVGLAAERFEELLDVEKRTAEPMLIKCLEELAKRCAATPYDAVAA